MVTNIIYNRKVVVFIILKYKYDKRLLKYHFESENMRNLMCRKNYIFVIILLENSKNYILKIVFQNYT